MYIYRERERKKKKAKENTYLYRRFVKNRNISKF